LFLGLALALELMCFLAINTVVDQPRPNVVRLGALPSTSSFPSGHTAAMLALYGGLAIILSDRFRSWVVRFALWLVALLATAAIGFGRVYRGMHYPSDAVAGALLGLSVLCVAAVAVRAGQLAIAKRSGAHPEEPRRSFLSEVVR
ncbi:MAG: phosphatase PAP2 family protein, partial [Ilumatobacteraceae bacterium]